MTPRSLVGMTMGARKRRALSAQEDDALSRLMRDPLKVLCGHFDAHDNAEQYRKPYRIGQRLRPCPGEYQCKNCLQNNWCRCTDTEADAECVICGVLQHWPCDGSGVLPARAKKVRR